MRKGVNQITFDFINPHEALNYAAEDSDVALALHKIFKDKLFYIVKILFMKN